MTTPEGRYTRWNGLSWTNLSVSTIVEEIVAKPDSERIGELVELLESTVEPGDEQDPDHVEPFACIQRGRSAGVYEIARRRVVEPLCREGTL